MYSLGIDIGYSSVKIAIVDENEQVKYGKYQLHKGKVKETLLNAIYEMLKKIDYNDISYGCVTGSASKSFTKSNTIEFINEAVSIVEGGVNVNSEIKSIIEIGGQSAKYITGFNNKYKSRMEISMNSNCSAGTGSFLEEQMSRLNLRLEDYSTYVERAKSIPRIAGRCSVFAKTDITHHQQEGVPVEDILLGLAYAIVKNYRGSVMKKLPIEKPILFVGGVAHNKGIIKALNDVLKLKENELIIPDQFSYVGAIGAALNALRKKTKLNIKSLIKAIETADEDEEETTPLPKLISYGKSDAVHKHTIKNLHEIKNPLNCYLGIDVGSTSTNLVLVDENKEILSYKYLRTYGNPARAVKYGLEKLKNEIGNMINIIGVGTTGSGRYMIGKLVGADVIKDEITAQAKAAVTIDTEVDTIFEIGGQDSKYISLQDGIVTDFQMNKICAAGTGSFIEEQSKKFNIPINDFGNIALSSDKPIQLGERCTVFMETSIAAHLSRGAKIQDIASGLCYSIVNNYLGRVVGQKKVGKKIFLQGGIAYNQGIVNAFRALTGKDIIVPPFFSVTGAYGAALLAKEEMIDDNTNFIGFNLSDSYETLNKQTMVSPKQNNQFSFNKRVNDLIFQKYDGSIDKNKLTVGIPRALFTYGMFSMFYTIFKELGFNVLLSEPTSEKTIALGQQYALAETCYPIKLINGHVAELVEKNVDYIFFPDLYSVNHPGSMARKDFGCAYMQLSFKVINQAMELKKKDIKLLAPTIAFTLGKEFMMQSFALLGNTLGRTSEQMNRALQKGMESFNEFEEKIEESGKKALANIKPDEKVFVIISKLYGVADPVLNMGIPAKLMDMGYKVIPFYELPEGDISKEHPNMFWPFGQHILEPAQLIKQHPNFYAVLLTHHGCGPDSILSHYFREEMGDKPYLHIEVDEHSSGVGVITRVEAFINSLEKRKIVKAGKIDDYVRKITHKEANIKTNFDLLGDSTVYLPYLYPYSKIFEEILSSKGIKSSILKETDAESVSVGRKMTITEEYFSLTALLGDVFKQLNVLDKNETSAFFIPQYEGTETDGQYARLLRTKLDEEGFSSTKIVSPFIEDALIQNQDIFNILSLGLLAGDLVRNACLKNREVHLNNILDAIKNDTFSLEYLKVRARLIRKELKISRFKKNIFVTGEPLVVFNDFMNNNTFRELECNGYRIVYNPLSEMLWMMWSDYINQNNNENTPMMKQRLSNMENNIYTISECLSEESPFENDLYKLISIADKTVGYYSGAFGRYRQSKLLSDLSQVDGIINVTSMYENTGIVLGILHKSFNMNKEKPLLSLTFDGNKNENDKTKIDSFMYYL